MFNLGSNQPTSSRMKFAATGVGRSMSAIGIVTSGAGGLLSGVSVLTMGSSGGPRYVAGPRCQRKPGSRERLRAFCLCSLNPMEIVMRHWDRCSRKGTSFTLL